MCAYIYADFIASSSCYRWLNALAHSIISAIGPIERKEVAALSASLHAPVDQKCWFACITCALMSKLFKTLLASQICCCCCVCVQGKTFLVVGAGGAGRALAFGAASRGAKVLIANRNKARADALAAAVPGGATVVSWEDLQSGAVSADVLANSTSVGMVPNVEETPVATEAVGKVRRT
jgi:hypothetical protein